MNVYYSFSMKTDGTIIQISGQVSLLQGGSEWIDLAEALAYLEWLEFQRILWGYDSIPSNSPNQDRIN